MGGPLECVRAAGCGVLSRGTWGRGGINGLAGARGGGGRGVEFTMSTGKAVWFEKSLVQPGREGRRGPVVLVELDSFFSPFATWRPFPASILS